MNSSSNADNSCIIQTESAQILSADDWPAEAPSRMPMINLDLSVAENPAKLVVYGGIGHAARNPTSSNCSVAALRRLKADQKFVVQSEKPVGTSPTHEDARRLPWNNPETSVLSHPDVGCDIAVDCACEYERGLSGVLA